MGLFTVLIHIDLTNFGQNFTERFGLVFVKFELDLNNNNTAEQCPTGGDHRQATYTLYAGTYYTGPYLD